VYKEVTAGAHKQRRREISKGEGEETRGTRTDEVSLALFISVVVIVVFISTKV
jgi:hypothetical protein